MNIGHRMVRKTQKSCGGSGQNLNAWSAHPAVGWRMAPAAQKAAATAQDDERVIRFPLMPCQKQAQRPSMCSLWSVILREKPGVAKLLTRLID